MKNFKNKIIYFLLGVLLMFILDVIFHFNNSVEAEIDREANKAQRKIENIFKK
ncbi:MAG: hypothetical protein HQ522_10540 [Bacteroidetes bacterium]|nr:hypothetical protein [Bacteroidota bacterium]